MSVMPPTLKSMGFTLLGSTASDPMNTAALTSARLRYSRTHYDRTSGLALKASPRELARDMLR